MPDMWDFFVGAGLNSLGSCLSWRADPNWFYGIFDLVSGFAFFSISIALVVLSRRRPDIAFGRIFVLFALFIVACGIRHFTLLLNLWVPAYGLAGVTKGVAATLSVIVAFTVWPMVGEAVELGSVTQMRARDELLRQTEQQLSQVTRWLALGEESAGVGHWSLSLPDKVLTWSNEIYRIYGVSRATFTPSLEAAIATHVVPDGETVRQQLTDIVENGGSYQSTLRIRRPTGEIRHIKTRGMVQRDSDGTPVAVLGIVIDKTDEMHRESERKAREIVLAAAEESAEWYRLLSENATDIIFEVDLSMNYNYVSPSAEHILGEAPEEIMATSPLMHVHPDDRDAVHAAYMKVATTGSPSSVEFRQRHKDGHWISMEVVLRKISDPRGNTRSILGVARDVSLRNTAETIVREAEAHYRLLAENVSDLVVCLSAEWVVTFASPSSLRLLGLEPEEMLGRVAQALAHPDDWPRLKSYLSSLGQGGEPHTLQYRAARKDGTWLWVQAFGRISDTSSIVISERDISAQKAMEERLRATDARLAALSRADT